MRMRVLDWVARRRPLLALAGGYLASCTLVTEVNDYEVDPSAEQLMETRDLEFTFIGFWPHPGQPLDVAIVSDDSVLQGRARIVLPLLEGSNEEYPEVELPMKNALPPGGHRLLVYADTDGDGLVDFTEDEEGNRGFKEHIWQIPLDPDGVGEFVHEFTFMLFTEADYLSVEESVVMELPMLGGAPPAIIQCLDDAIDGDLDIKIFLAAEERQVGLFRRSPGTPFPANGIKLPGIVDAGSAYRIEVFVDGEQRKVLDRTAPTQGDLVVPASDWVPFSVAELGCR